MSDSSAAPGAAVEIVDSHCHLDFPDFAGEEAAVVARARAAGVGRMVTICTRLRQEPQVRALAEAHAPVFYAAGTHPMSAAEEPLATVAELVALARHPKMVAIGETGLDYYWHKDAPEWQRERFRVHIRAARHCGLPLVVHTRDSAADTLRVMKEEGADAVGGVMHCFTETWEVASAALDLGFHLSFSGILTFKNALQIKEVAKKAPLDRILVETDAPYLAPVPFRGKLNQPAYVHHVAEELARLRGISLAEVADATTTNFIRLFPRTRSFLETNS